MRISAAGRADARPRADPGTATPRRSAESGFTSIWRSAENGFTPIRRSAENGFTLVELLVVLTIIALVSAAVVLAMPGPRGNLVAEAERFAARARAAQERAIMDNRPIALRVSTTAYAFDRRQDGAWQPMTEKPFASQQWGEGVQVAVAATDGRTVFDATGFADPMRVVLSRGREQAAVDIANGGSIRVAH